MLLCSYIIFLLRDQWLIERLSEAMGAALFGISFHPEFPPEIYKALKPF